MAQIILVTPYDYDAAGASSVKATLSRVNMAALLRHKLKIAVVAVLVVLLTVTELVFVKHNGLYTPNFESMPSVEYFDLANYAGDADGWQRENRVLVCVPLRDAAAHLPMFFGHMRNLTYPHHLVDMAFLVSDLSDDTMGELQKQLTAVQTHPDSSMHFGQIEIFEKDFGQVIGQSFSDRHGFAAQGPRRKLMARARNWLWAVAIKPHHLYVYWRDADVETAPPTILEDLMHHDKDVIVPNVWRPLPDWLGNQQPYDLNLWVELDGGLQLAQSLDEDACIVEGYAEYQTWRPHLAYLRDPYGDPETEMDLDGIGGVSILTKARVFRSGAHFPAFSFEKHAETEAFGKMCKRMGYLVVGLPHYVIWHIYEPSLDDLKHMEWMALEEVRKEEQDRIMKVYDKVWDQGFADRLKNWEHERNFVKMNTNVNRKVNVDWSGVDDMLGKGDNKKLADFKP